MKKNIDYTLYLCTDRNLMSSATIEENVELALSGGCTVVQLREKSCSSREFYDIAVKVKKITDKYNAALIINDRVDIAMAVKADGVHIGQSDLSADVVRSIVGQDMVIGVSVSNIEEAKKAVADGADYLGVGAMYATDTKTDAKVVTMEELLLIRQKVQIPIVVIGGINMETLHNFKNKGIDGLAVISAIVSQKDVRQAAQNILKAFKE